MSIKEPLRVIWDSLLAWWDSWVQVVIIGFFWVVCCITVLLGPPATFGFFHFVRDIYDHNMPTWKDFYQASRSYFFKSWIWMVVNLLVLVMFYSNWIFYGRINTSWAQILQGLTIGIWLLWTEVQFFAVPYLIIQEKKSLRLAWKNGLLTILAAPLFSLILWFGMGILILLHLFILPLLLGGPGLIIILASTAVENRLQAFGVRNSDSDDAG